MEGKPDPKGATQSVELTIEMLRREINGMTTTITRNTSGIFQQSMTSVNQAMEENKMENEKRAKEQKQRQKREAEKRHQDYEATIQHCEEQMEEHQRTINELRGRLEECRTAKNQALVQLSETRNHYEKEAKELQKSLSKTMKELLLLQDKRKKDVSASSKLEQLEEKLEEAQQELKEVRRIAEDLGDKLESKEKAFGQLEVAYQELKESKENVEKDCNAVKAKMADYLAELKEKSEQNSLCKVLEDQLEKAHKDLSEVRMELAQEKTRSNKWQETATSIQEKKKEDDSLYIRKIADLNCEVSQLRAGKREMARKMRGEERYVEQMEEMKTTHEADLEDHKKQVSLHKEQIKELTSALDDVKTAKKQLENTSEDLTRRAEAAERKVTTCENVIEEKTQVVNEMSEQLEGKDREIKGLKENVELLKKTSTVLDEQLGTFETLLEEKEQEIKAGENMRTLLNNENKDIREQLRQARIELNESKSLTAFVEQRMQSTESNLETITKSKDSEVCAVIQKMEMVEMRCQRLMTEMAKITTEQSNLEAENFEMKKEQESWMAERDKNTRDLHGLLKSVLEAKNVNCQLTLQLDRANCDARRYRDVVEELEIKLTELEKSLSVKEVKYNTITQQQKKLIDHLTEQLSIYQEKHEKKKRRPNIFTPKRHGRDPVTPGTPGSSLPQRAYLTPTFVSATAAHLEQEKLQVMQLEATRENLKSHLQNLQMTATPVTKRTQTLPAPKKEDCVLLKETSNTLAVGGGRAKLVAGKSHRLCETFSKKNARCAVCWEAVYQDRPISKCEECGDDFHLKCVAAAVDNCGNQRKAAIGLPENSPFFSIVPDEEYRKGWANVLTGTMSAPAKRFLKIEDTSLNVYLSDQALSKPVESFKLDEYTTVCFRIDAKKEAVLKPLKENFKFGMKVVFYSAQQESTYIYMFLEHKVQKRFWSRAISKYSKIKFLSGDETLFSDLSFRGDENKGSYAMNLVEKSLLEDNGSKALYVNCVAVIPNSRQYVLGCEDGLYSLKTIGAKPVKIQGPVAVYHIELLKDARLAVFVEGPDKIVSTAELRLFKISAEAAECSDPKLTMDAVARTKDCYNLSTRCYSMDDTVVAAASGNHLFICMMREDRKSLTVVRELNIKECSTSLLITPYSVLYGNYDVFEIDTQSFRIEEFLDTSCDSIYLLKNVYENYGNYPVAILDVTESNGCEAMDPEYLICFQDIGIFVNNFGQPTRDGDLLWTNVPLFVEYRHPFLYIFHPSNIEVKKLEKNSYRHFVTQVNTTSKEGKKCETVQQRIYTPVSRFYPVKLKSKSAPRYIGKGEEGVVFVFNETGSTKVFELVAT